MKKMSEFLDLPVEPAFRETQVILTGKRRAIVENYRNLQRYTREQTCDPWKTPGNFLLYSI